MRVWGTVGCGGVGRGTQWRLKEARATEASSDLWPKVWIVVRGRRARKGRVYHCVVEEWAKVTVLT